MVADALDMAGVSRLYRANPGRAAVDAFKAGNDVLTMPNDLDASYQAVFQAVRSGEISESRLNESVLKILRAKALVGLAKNRFVDVQAIPQRVGIAQNAAIGQRISDDSVTLVRDNSKLLPLTPWASAKLVAQRRTRFRRKLLVIVLCDSVRAEDGRVLQREILQRRPDANVVLCRPGDCSAEL